MIRTRFRNGEVRDFVGLGIQKKNSDRVLAVFDSKQVIIAEFRAEDVSEWLEIPDVSAVKQLPAEVI